MLISNRATNILLVLILAVSAGIVAMLASGARGGPLDPTGPPASTMQTLANIPGSWSRALNSTNGDAAGCGSERFECVFFTVDGGCTQLCLPTYTAVLDHETGLVWQRRPSTTIRDWGTAYDACGDQTTGDLQGWRLPTREELKSLQDPNSSYQLPTGHPFLNVSGNDGYWSATTVPLPPGGWVYAVYLGKISATGWPPNDLHLMWCVRGAGGYDAK